MPHKHKRQSTSDKSSFDLPPSSLAKPLPTFKSQKSSTAKGPTRTTDAKVKRNKDDDTPRAFARLMQFQTTGKPLPSGLDDGSAQKRGKKRKQSDDADTTSDTKLTDMATAAEAQQNQAPPVPKIMPGERLSDFAARVDQALPISGLRGTGKQTAAKVPGLKEKTTKHNRRLERMQKEWREEERRRKEKMEEEMDEFEDEKEEQEVLWSKVPNGAKGKKKKKRSAATGVAGADDEDPWAALDKTRKESKQKNLQDVVQAPPQLKKLKTSTIHDYGGAGVDVGNVPISVGSLRKREEMGEERRAVIERYRSMTKNGSVRT